MKVSEILIHFYFFCNRWRRQAGLLLLTGEIQFFNFHHPHFNLHHLTMTIKCSALLVSFIFTFDIRRKKSDASPCLSLSRSQELSENKNIRCFSLLVSFTSQIFIFNESPSSSVWVAPST